MVPGRGRIAGRLWSFKQEHVFVAQFDYRNNFHGGGISVTRFVGMVFKIALEQENCQTVVANVGLCCIIGHGLLRVTCLLTNYEKYGGTVIDRIYGYIHAGCSSASLLASIQARMQYSLALKLGAVLSSSHVQQKRGQLPLLRIKVRKQ